MSRPWWKKILNFFGSFQMPFRSNQDPADVIVGSQDAVDADGGMEWRAFTNARQLYAAWAPPSDSTWENYHCAPLFSAIDRIAIQNRGCAKPEEVRVQERAVADVGLWLTRRDPQEQKTTLTIINLPGVESVSLAATLIEHGVQCVFTFNHWPHKSALLRCEHILARLIHYAPRVNRARSLLQQDSPVAWICDSGRIAPGPARVLDYDNRYFLDESNLPGVSQMRAAGITSVCLVVSDTAQPYSADLAPWFQWLAKNGFSDVYCVAANNPEKGPQPLPAAQDLKSASYLTYHRNAAGGFGQYIAPASSGSSG